MIYIEVVDSHLEYNTLLGCSYMYSMRVFSSSIVYIMVFPLNEKIVTLDQLNYYDSYATINHKNVLPTVREVNQPAYIDIGPGVYKYFYLDPE